MNKHRSNDEAECIAGMLHGQPIDAKGLSLNEMLAKSPELVSMTMEELGLDMQCSIGSLVEEYFDGSLDACEFSEKMLRLGSFDEVIVNIIEFAKIFDPLMTETLLEDCLYEQQKISVIMGFLRALDVNFDDGDDSVTIDR